MRNAGKDESNKVKEPPAQGARWLSEGICDGKNRPQEELQGTLLPPRTAPSMRSRRELLRTSGVKEQPVS